MECKHLHIVIKKNHSLQTANELAHFLNSNYHCLGQYLNYLFGQDVHCSQNAAWALSKIDDNCSLALIENLDSIIKMIIPNLHNSVYRNISRWFIFITKPQNINYLNDQQLDGVCEFSFNNLLDNKSPAAIKVFSMYTLANLCDKLTWVEPELRSHIQRRLSHEGGAFKSSSKKVLKQLDKSKK